MSRHGVKTSRHKGCMRAHAPRRSCGEPATQREIARASLLNTALVVMTGAFQQPARARRLHLAYCKRLRISSSNLPTSAGEAAVPKT